MTCTKCRRRQARKGRSWCGPCNFRKKSWTDEEYGWTGKRQRHVRGSVQQRTLTALKPSRAGKHGTVCARCTQAFEFFTKEGVAYEACRCGAKPIPRTKRCKCLHDQRSRLLHELATEVRNESARVDPTKRNGVRMQPITVGRAAFGGNPTASARLP